MSVAAAVATAAVGVSLPAPVAAQVRECTQADISVNLRLDDTTYARGQEPVRMTMVVKNTSGEACTMDWPSGNSHSFVVKKDGRRVWNSSRCHAYTQAVVEEEWPAGHRETYKARWRQRSNGDCDQRRLVSAGRFVARGVFHGAGAESSERERFRITA